MLNQAKLFELFKDGRVEGFSSKPAFVETVISRVFIFKEERKVFKFYKRDNEWWNSDMTDLSAGAPRIFFIRNDFNFNSFLNPSTYKSLKTANIENGLIKFTEPNQDDDELVIVMDLIDTSKTMTRVLSENKLALSEYEKIGEMFANVKASLPKSFLPETEETLLENMKKRLVDLKSWVYSAENFPKELADRGLAIMDDFFLKNIEFFASVKRSDLFPLIDCNSENVLYSDNKLSFLDAFPPKNDWRMGTYDVDIFRVGCDILAMSGQESYEAYMQGVKKVAPDLLDNKVEKFYLLYGALIMVPYFYMLSAKNEIYKVHAIKYHDFIEKFILTF